MDGALRIEGLDHVVLTVRDVDATSAWFRNALGVRTKEFGEGRLALVIGSQIINLHQAGRERAPHAAAPTPGAADLCLVAADPIEEVVRALHDAGVRLEEGPVARPGVRGPMRSVYVRDPDGNLIEISSSAGDRGSAG